ncbi:Mga1p NDAI_0B00940 [Naumovozyma dairenensis CBS 421]|uniref:HSF-type DNA-binding domain-containing protein n=1 Tax=Naumovozyma dairenensis (strain ATCC 10597 / BCRC 20456 / CBS 421 / NBRC 0211 / NRRL Y-12639) TaxID=1071378 RepID=G0W5R7_NAUDC|nr:hypothetical protein NDAI_0B00940 [Naumovozyma dairenensis CBS 421]CCD23128.1 hypothetical protein NDAI_0B00940 [Naumovozyma dairenensis CBS 421]
MQQRNFVNQLHLILQQKGLHQWIRWYSIEKSIFLLKPYDPNFSEKVLKKYFKHGNISSFVRQLHMYGFHKISSNDLPNSILNSNPNPNNRINTIWYFAHPSGFFTQTSTNEILKKIQRKSTGVDKDGEKRKNILSTLSVSYLNPNHHTPLNTSDVHAASVETNNIIPSENNNTTNSFTLKRKSENGQSKISSTHYPVNQLQRLPLPPISSLEGLKSSDASAFPNNKNDNHLLNYFPGYNESNKLFKSESHPQLFRINPAPGTPSNTTTSTPSNRLFNTPFPKCGSQPEIHGNFSSYLSDQNQSLDQQKALLSLASSLSSSLASSSTSLFSKKGTTIPTDSLASSRSSLSIANIPFKPKKKNFEIFANSNSNQDNNTKSSHLNIMNTINSNEVKIRKISSLLAEAENKRKIDNNTSFPLSHDNDIILNPLIKKDEGHSHNNIAHDNNNNNNNNNDNDTNVKETMKINMDIINESILLISTILEDLSTNSNPENQRNDEPLFVKIEERLNKLNLMQEQLDKLIKEEDK